MEKPHCKSDLLEKLSKEAPLFSAVNERWRRSQGLDSHLNQEKRDHLSYIDRLLDSLNVVGLEAIPTMPEVEDGNPAG